MQEERIRSKDEFQKSYIDFKMLILCYLMKYNQTLLYREPKKNKNLNSRITLGRTMDLAHILKGL